MDSVSNVPANFIATYGTLDAAGFITAASKREFTGHVAGVGLVIETFQPGSVDAGNTIGQVVVLRPSTPWVNHLVDMALVSHDLDGTLKAGAVDNAAVLGTDVVTTPKIINLGVTNAKLATDISPVKFANPYKFLVYRSAVLNLTMPASLKIAFDTEVFDTGSNFDNVTNFRFTAPVAGFYQFNALVAFSQGANCAGIVHLYKNGVTYLDGSYLPNIASIQRFNYVLAPPVISLAAADYVEVFLETNFTGTLGITAGLANTYFGGHLVSTT